MPKELRKTSFFPAFSQTRVRQAPVTKELSSVHAAPAESGRQGTFSAVALLASACATAMIAITTGCGTGAITNAAPATRATLTGKVHGGQQPVSNAHVFLYSVSTAAAANGAQASQSLLNSPGYVTTDVNGVFSITGDFTCAPGTYVYLLALGGNPGLTPTTVNNAKLALSAGLGTCPLSSSSFFAVNEVTTAAMAYSLAQFTSSDVQISASSAYATGLANAFANIANLVDPTSGFARTLTPGGNGHLPTATLNSLANSLAACVNSDGTGTPCSNLLSHTNVNGAGGTPTDTFQAALNTAKFPGTDVANIYSDAQANAPFQPSLTVAPNDWTLTVQYLGAPNPTLASSPYTCFAGGPFTDICQAQGIAIDASGDVWITNYNADSNGTYQQGSIVRFSPVGVEVSPAGGYTAPYMYRLQQIAIDTSGNAWTGTRAVVAGGTSYPDALVKIIPAGVPTSFTGGGIVRPRAVAVDKYGNIWTAGYSAATGGALAEFTSAGQPVSGTGYTTASLQNGTFKMNFDHLGNAWNITYDIGSNGSGSLVEYTPVSHAMNLQGTYGGTFSQVITSNIGAITQGMAIDASNHLWYSNFYHDNTVSTSGFLSEYTNSGTLVSGSGDTAGGISYPNDVIIDGSGNVFASGGGTPNSVIGEISNSGTAIAPAAGYQSINRGDCCLTGAIDNSGNLWLTGGVGIYQMIGIATPVITPIAATL